jgi:ABC-2 type transport system ATP-binding protein
LAAPLFATHALTHRYSTWPWSRSKEALRDISLAGSAGEIHALIGSNGAGKSTLLRHLAGLLPSDRVEVLGRPAGHQATRDAVVYLPDVHDSASRLTVAEAVDLQSVLYGFTGAERRERVAAALASVGMEEAAHRRLSVLSHGQRRRVGLAQALVPRARLLLLDEPLAGVDPVWSERIRGLLAALADEGVGIVLSSHHLADVEQVCHTVTVLDQGTIVVSGAVDEVLADREAWEISLSASGRGLPEEEAIQRALAPLGGRVELRHRRRRLVDLLRALARPGSS